MSLSGKLTHPHFCHLHKHSLLVYQPGTCNCVLLLLCEDVSLHPGPIRHPCTVFKKPVRLNRRALLCDK